MSNLETYVDPRQVTDAEARQYFADLGYTPTDEQVAQFVAQVAENRTVKPYFTVRRSPSGNT